MARSMIFTSVVILACGPLGCDRGTPRAVPVPPVSVHQAPTTAPTAEEVAALKNFVNDPGPAPTTAPAATRTPAGSSPGMGIPTPSAPANALKYDAPADWISVKPDSAMRKAQWSLPHAEADTDDGVVILFYFGAGQGGGVAGNINRWKGMFTTDDGKPLADDAVKTESFKANDLKVTVVELSGRYAESSMRPGAPAATPKSNYRMIAAIVETADGSWYFRCTGPSATMAKHEAGVRSLLKSVRQ